MRVMGFEWSGRKVLVTGASGFKGAWLSAALLGTGARVYGTVRQQRNHLSAFDILGLGDRVVSLSVDISDRQQVSDVLNSVEPDVVFHLAAKALVPVALRDPRRAFEVNVMGTLNILEACRNTGVCKRLIVCSSDHVFGRIEPSDLPVGGFTETDPVGFCGPYDTSKAAMELMVRSYDYTYRHQLPCIAITRAANIFGFGDTNQRRVIPQFVRAAVHQRLIPLKFRHSGRQFLHVTDAVAGYLRVASAIENGGRATPPAASGDTTTPTYHFALQEYDDPAVPYVRMESLARRVAAMFTAVVDDAECVDYPDHENKVQALNCSATQAALHWQARKSLEEALEDLGAWYRAERDGESLRRLVRRDLELLLNELSD